jgi:hypothetical protein
MERLVFINRNLLTNYLLDTTKILSFILITEGDSDAPLACTSRASNAVHIDLGLVG